ncbi:MAG: hypothetical protein FWC95_01410 [Defluviitaleaceae bacterium]|nr:hypothetical protein [Defluviitaleaceae bacterium]
MSRQPRSPAHSANFTVHRLYPPGAKALPLKPVYDPRIYKHYSAPLWQAGAYDFHLDNGKLKLIIGFEYKNSKPDDIELDIKNIPAAMWAVFTIKSPTSAPYVPDEWFPTSGYIRDEAAPNMDVFGGGDASSVDYE